jgi:alkaline phosphatase D
VLKRSEFPQRWHYDNDRSGDLLIVADRGYYIRDGSRTNFETRNKEKKKIGVHGYDAFDEKDMWGIFYAQGPNIRNGEVVPAFENIHIYPFIAQILHLQIPVIDGDAAVLNKIYKP